jgi:hypothetical protein
MELLEMGGPKNAPILLIRLPTTVPLTAKAAIWICPNANGSAASSSRLLATQNLG